MLINFNLPLCDADYPYNPEISCFFEISGGCFINEIGSVPMNNGDIFIYNDTPYVLLCDSRYFTPFAHELLKVIDDSEEYVLELLSDNGYEENYLLPIRETEFKATVIGNVFIQDSKEILKRLEEYGVLPIWNRR